MNLQRFLQIFPWSLIIQLYLSPQAFFIVHILVCDYIFALYSSFKRWGWNELEQRKIQISPCKTKYGFAFRLLLGTYFNSQKLWRCTEIIRYWALNQDLSRDIKSPFASKSKNYQIKICCMSFEYKYHDILLKNIAKGEYRNSQNALFRCLVKMRKNGQKRAWGNGVRDKSLPPSVHKGIVGYIARLS